MRRENSEIEVKFLTNAGTQLYNNDYYGSAELDKYACYVVADGLEQNDIQDEAAQIAIESIINAFEENPGISRLKIMHYINEAQKMLEINSYYSRLRASITFVVTDYQKIRFVSIGNSRGALFRKSRAIFETKDDSLSWDLMEQGELSKDRVAKHEERANLSKYLGGYGKVFPSISKKIKLQEGDAFAIYTRGVWENADTNDIITVFAEANTVLDESLNLLERIVSDIKPPNIMLPVGQRRRGRPPKITERKRDVENYTIGLGFVSKVYVDPNRAKRIKLLKRILIPLIIILIILSIIIFFWRRDRRIKREDMYDFYISGVQYTIDDNYDRAAADFQSALRLATKIKSKNWKTEIDNHLKMVEAVTRANELMDAGDYSEAQAAYVKARNHARYTNHIGDVKGTTYNLEDYASSEADFSTYHLGIDYIERRVKLAGEYASVQEYIMLGDTLTDSRSFEMAEEKYIEARRLASKIPYPEGKQMALDGLDRMYKVMEDHIAAQEDKALSNLQDEMVAAELVAQGDTSFAEGDLITARLYYEMAKEKYSELENTVISKNIDERVKLLEQKEVTMDDRREIAQNYIIQGDEYAKKTLYESAKRQYILARDIYASLNDTKNLEIVNGKITSAEDKLAGEEAEKKRKSRTSDISTVIK